MNRAPRPVASWRARVLAGLGGAALLLVVRPAGAQETVDTANNQLSPYGSGRAYTVREQKELRQLNSDHALYRRGAGMFRQTVAHLIERSFLNEKWALVQRYRKNLDEASRLAQSRRLEAIKEYEAFIKRHPSDRIWTPHVLMRLAELYFEKAEVDFRYAKLKHQRALTEYERLSDAARELVPAPKTPLHDYAATINYYRELVRRFPRYKNRDLVLYVLGYVLRLQAMDYVAADEPALNAKARFVRAQSRQAFLGLVCANQYKALHQPSKPQPPVGYNISPVYATPPAAPGVGSTVAAASGDPFEGFDPYGRCKPYVDPMRFKGKERKRRRFLLSQSWFLLGEQHFDADPKAELTDAEWAAIRQRNAGLTGPDVAEILRNRGFEVINEKKLRLLRVHNYYAISAYTRIAKKYPDSKEYNSALYKRAWAFFKIDKYVRALNEFDYLLVRAKEKELKENAVRYIALCAFYQKEMSAKPFEWLLRHYKRKGWLGTGQQGRYPHIKEAFEQLANVFWEESAPPPDDPGPANYAGENLEKSYQIYSWILTKGGFSAPGVDPGNVDKDWKFYKNKAPIQVRLLQILGLLAVNADPRIRKRYPRKRFYEERKAGHDRFASYQGAPHKGYADEYEKRWGRDVQVSEALLRLREGALTAMAREFYEAGGEHYNAYVQLAQKQAVLAAQVKAFEKLVKTQGQGWKNARWKLPKMRQQLADLTTGMKKQKETAQKYFKQAVQGFTAIVHHPKFKNTLTSYRYRFYLGLAQFYLGDYRAAADTFKAVQDSKISVRRAKAALTWRLSSFNELIRNLKLPPEPKGDTKIVARELPPALVEYHQLLTEAMKRNPEKHNPSAYRYLMALHYYRYHQMGEAFRRFQEIIEKDCKTKYALFAGERMLVIVNLQKGPGHLDRLEGLAHQLKTKSCGPGVTTCRDDDLACKAYIKTKKEHDKYLKNLGPRILEQRALAAYRAKNYGVAAAYFRQILKKYPDHKDVALFLYYAAIAFEKLKMFQSAKRNYLLIWNKYREQAKATKITDGDKVIDASILDNVVVYLADVARKAVDYSTALKYYGILATSKEFEKHPDRVAWYYQYANLLKFHGKFDQAIDYYRRYVTDVRGKLSDWRRAARNATTPRDKKKYEGFIEEAEEYVPRADLEIGHIRKRQGRFAAMIRAYDTYVRFVENKISGLPAVSKEFWTLPANVKIKDQASEMMKLLIVMKEKTTSVAGKIRIESRMLRNYHRFKLNWRMRQAANAAAEIAFAKLSGLLARFKKVKFTYGRMRFYPTRGKVLTSGGRRTLKKQIAEQGFKVVFDAIRSIFDKTNQALYDIYSAGLDQKPPFVVPKEGGTGAMLGNLFEVWSKTWGPANPQLIGFMALVGRVLQMASTATAEPELPAPIKRYVDLLVKHFARRVNQDPDEFRETLTSKLKKQLLPTALRTQQQEWERLAKSYYKNALEIAAKLSIANQWTDQIRRWRAEIDATHPYVNPAKIEGF